MLNGETRRASVPPDTSSQTAWEDADHKRNLFPYRCKRSPEHQTDQTKIELPHSILSLKQQVQRHEKEY
jgi:hypothetical protein